MNKTNNTKANEADGISEELSIGKILQNARNEAGLSLDDVSENLKVPLSKLVALENDDFASLPSLAFSRGLARSYASYLHLDDNLLLPYLEKHFPRRSDSTSKNTSLYSPIRMDKAKKPSSVFSYIAILIVLLFIAVVAWWFFNGMWRIKNHKPLVTETKLSASTSLPATLKISASVPILVSSSAASETLNNAKNTASLELKASSDVWVSVYDAKGLMLINGILASGASKTVVGVPPLRVRASNRRRIKLKYNNNPVDFVSKRGQKAQLSIELK